MRGFLIFVVIAGLGFFFIRQKENQTSSPVTKSAAAQAQAIAANPQSTPRLTPAPRGQASEHNWMKRALDRAADVRDNARAKTKEAQDP
jgi:hypothetical protein